jgi:excisionase family DNA binding protein
MPAKQAPQDRIRPSRPPKAKLKSPVVYGPEPLAVKPNEAAKLIGVGKNALYRLLASREIGSIKLGHSRLVPLSELRAWIARELESQGV